MLQKRDFPRFLQVASPGDVDLNELIYADARVHNRRPDATIVKIVRRGDVAHLPSSGAGEEKVNVYASLDSVAPVGKIAAKDIVKIHIPVKPGAHAR